MSKRRASNRLSQLIEPDERQPRRSRNLFADQSNKEDTSSAQTLVSRPRGRPPGSKRSTQAHETQQEVVSLVGPSQMAEQEVVVSNQPVDQDIVALVGPSQVKLYFLITI
jgi:hypothetical protein